jgi:hypothetical protein
MKALAVFAGIGLVAVAAAVGCNKGGGEMVKAQEGFADKVCACTDVECVKGVQKEQEEWVSKHGQSGIGSEADAEKIAAANKRLQDCAMKVLSSGAKGGKSGGAKTAETAKSDATAAATAAAADTAAAAGGGDLFAGAALVDAAAKFKEKVGGPLKLLEMLVYPTYAKIQAQDPKKAENVDEYEFRNGKVSDPVPVKIQKMGSGASLEPNLFPLDEVNLAGFAELITKAVAAAKIDDGKATHVMIKRGLPFNKDITLRVFIKGTRKDGWVEADAKGNIVKTKVD